MGGKKLTIAEKIEIRDFYNSSRNNTYRVTMEKYKISPETLDDILKNLPKIPENEEKLIGYIQFFMGFFNTVFTGEEIEKPDELINSVNEAQNFLMTTYGGDED